MPVLTPVVNPLETPTTPTAPITTPTVEDVTTDISNIYTGVLDSAPAVPEYKVPETIDTSIPSGAEYVTPETQVSTQLTNLLASDSPYMQQVANQSAEQANQLGLLSSTMAVGAGQRAAIESALPIATQDAQTYGAFMQGQQKAEYEVAQDIMSTELNASYLQHKSEVDTIFQTAIKSADVQAQAVYQDAQNQWDYQSQISIKEFDNQWTERLANGQVSQERYNTAMQSIGAITQNTQTNIAQILTDPDVSSMDPAAVAAMLNNIQDHAIASIEFVGGIGNIDSAELAVLLDTFTAATDWAA